MTTNPLSALAFIALFLIAPASALFAADANNALIKIECIILPRDKAASFILETNPSGNADAALREIREFAGMDPANLFTSQNITIESGRRVDIDTPFGPLSLENVISADRKYMGSAYYLLKSTEFKMSGVCATAVGSTVFCGAVTNADSTRSLLLFLTVYAK